MICIGISLAPVIMDKRVLIDFLAFQHETCV